MALIQNEKELEFAIFCVENVAIRLGGVANDKVFNTVELFFDGLIDKGEAIKRKEVIDDYLHFESERL